MKAFVTGVSGQLGYDVVKELLDRGYRVTGSSTAEIEKSVLLAEKARGAASYEFAALDITDGAATEALLQCVKPDVVVHCAAWTAVDAAEEEENIEKVTAVNVTGTRNIATVCKELDCKMIYISTDYVFDGSGERPWEPEDEGTGALSVYGRSKYLGESAVKEILSKYFIVRTAWAFGPNGNNFVKTMLTIGKKYDTLRVVKDQIGTPTYTPDLARLLADMAETEKYGCYHATNEGGYVSWYEFACEIFKQAGYDTKVTPVTTEEYGLSKAKRPLNSRLDKSKLVREGFMPLPEWKDGLRRYLESVR